MNFKLKQNLIPPLILLVAGCICYFNTLNSPFIWDDEVTIVNNPLIKSWKHFPDIFKTSIFGKKMEGISYFRPVQNLTYLFDYSLWKLDVRGYHIVNVLLHIFNAYFIFLVLSCISPPVKFPVKSFLAGKRKSKILFNRGIHQSELFYRIPLIVSLLFVIHPINTEAVTYISGRGDLLAVFFSLLSFLLFLHSYFFPSVIFFIIALFAKESIVILSFIILTYFLLFLRKPHPYPAIARKGETCTQGLGGRKKYKLPVLIFLLISGIYIFVKLAFVYYSSTASLSTIRDASFFERILTLPRILVTYVRLLILPVHLHMEYLFVEKSLNSPYIWAGIPFLVFLIYFFSKFVKPRPIFLFFILWFLIGLVPFCNIIVPLHATLLEHWLYFPSIGLLTLIVYSFPSFLEKILTPKELAFTVSKLLLFGFIVFFIFATIRRNSQWGDAIYLYSHDLKYEPRSFLLWNNLGVELYRKGLFPDAKVAFLKAIEVSPGNRYAVSHNNLGVIYENEGRIEDAISIYRRSIELNNYVLAYGNLGRILILQKKIDEAARILKKGFSLYPYDAEINKYLGIVKQ